MKNCQFSTTKLTVKTNSLKINSPKINILGLALVVSLFSQTSLAEETIRHTVVKGETLWGISEKYLENPWLWPEIFKQNKNIENPSLIYPKDVLLISPLSIRVIRSSQLTVEKRSPEIRASSLHKAITTIDPSAITPFLTQSLVLENNDLADSGYVLQGTRGEIVLRSDVEVFANGVDGEVGQRFQLFRIGRPIVDTKTGETYGIEGVHLGIATIIESGGISKLYINAANQEILPGDRITPIVNPTSLPRYLPHKPATHIETYITMIPRGIAEAARRDVAVIVGGKDRGFEPGHVLLTYADGMVTKDPITNEPLQLPPVQTGTVMVFQVHDRVSYVIIMSSTDPIKIGDIVVSP